MDLEDTKNNEIVIWNFYDIVFLNYIMNVRLAFLFVCLKGSRCILKFLQPI